MKTYVAWQHTSLLYHFGHLMSPKEVIIMPRHKSNATLCPYLTARLQSGVNRERRFIQIGTSLLHDKNFQDLSSQAQHLYFCMAMDAGGRFDFKFSRADALRYGFSYSTFLRAKNQLISNHFIRVKSNGRWTRTANWYTFDLSWKPIPAPWPMQGCARGAQPLAYMYYI